MSSQPPRSHEHAGAGDCIIHEALTGLTPHLCNSRGSGHVVRTIFAVAPARGGAFAAPCDGAPSVRSRRFGAGRWERFHRMALEAVRERLGPPPTTPERAGTGQEGGLDLSQQGGHPIARRGRGQTQPCVRAPRRRLTPRCGSLKIRGLRGGGRKYPVRDPPRTSIWQRCTRRVSIGKLQGTSGRAMRVAADAAGAADLDHDHVVGGAEAFPYDRGARAGSVVETRDAQSNHFLT